jgi:spermidine synthase
MVERCGFHYRDPLNSVRSPALHTDQGRLRLQLAAGRPRSTRGLTGAGQAPYTIEGLRMSSWIHLDTAEVPGGHAEMRLMQSGEVFSIMVGAIELMTSEYRGSERALATLTCARLADRNQARILIGGLGMGFTLLSALGALGSQASVVVAELVPAVAAWARGPLAHLFAGSLDDPRVTLRLDDVTRVIQSGPEQFDAILLDVDNGPQPLTKGANRRLYDIWGLRRARYALRPNGILAVWSGAPNRQFKARLKMAGFDVEEVRVYAHGSSGPRHVLWLARRPGESGQGSPITQQA